MPRLWNDTDDGRQAQLRWQFAFFLSAPAHATLNSPFFQPNCLKQARNVQKRISGSRLTKFAAKQLSSRL